MKILHTVEGYFPSTGGMQEVVKQLSERLVQMGHEVTVATSWHPDRSFAEKNGVKIVSFRIKGNHTKGYEGDCDSYRRYLLESDKDVIVNFAAQQWATDLMLPLLSQIRAAKVFVPTGFSGLFSMEYEEYFKQMALWMKYYDMNVFLSEDYRDIDFARKNGITKTIVIPNGADEKEFEGDSIKGRRNGLSLLHVGSFTHVKGHDEAIGIFLKARIPNSTLSLVCNNEQELREYIASNWKLNLKIRFSRWFYGKKIIIKKLSRQETVQAYKEADLFLFPSNIECSPIVLFEAMASHTPFLTTDVGNSKEIIEWAQQGGALLPTEFDKEGYSHPRISESALLLEKMAADKGLRHRMGEAGYSSWKKNFSWAIIAKRYEDLYETLVAKTQNGSN